MSWQSPDDAYNAVKEHAKKVRRRIWHMFWHVPALMVIGLAPGVSLQNARMRDTPNGLMILDPDMVVPGTTMAYTVNGQVLKAFDRVTDQFTPGETSPDEIVNTYLKNKIDLLMKQSRMFARICDYSDVGPQCQISKVIELTYGMYTSEEIQIPTSDTKYLDYPQGYTPVSDNGYYYVKFVGAIAFRNLAGDEIPSEWGGGEQPYIDIAIRRGRLSLEAVDANGNRGLIADVGFAVYIANGTDTELRITIPPILDTTIYPHMKIFTIITNSWTMHVEYQEG